MNILITGAFAYTGPEIEKLRHLGFSVSFMQYEDGPLPVEAGDIDAVVCNGLFLHKDIEEFKKLRFIQLTSAGMDRVPLETIKQKGIEIRNARGVYSVPIAEWVICKVLDIYKGTFFAYECQQKAVWQKNRNLREISGKKVAVLGAGSVGSEVARHFKAFGAEVIGYDVVIFDNGAFDGIRKIERFEEEAHLCDIVVITLPLTDATASLVDKGLLEKLKHDAVLVNVARGKIINEDDLITVLADRPDLTAVLDVFSEEPLPESSPLWSMPNVIVSPHNSFISDGNHRRMFDVIYSNLQAFKENK